MSFDYLRSAFGVCTCRVSDPLAFTLLLGLANYANREGSSFPKMGSLARTCRMDERSVRRKLRTLELAGVVEVKAGVGRVHSRYKLRQDGLTTHSDGTPIDEPCPSEPSAETEVLTGLMAPSERTNGPLRADLQSAQSGLMAPSERTNGPLVYKEEPVLEPVIEPSLSARARDPKPPAEKNGVAKEREKKPSSPIPGGEKTNTEADEAKAAWARLCELGGERMSSARVATPAALAAWAKAWRASGAKLQDAELVGSYIAAKGLDGIKKPKWDYLATDWPRALAQALEHQAKNRPAAKLTARALPPSQSTSLAEAKAKAVPMPAEAAEALAKLFGGSLPGAPKPAAQPVAPLPEKSLTVVEILTRLQTAKRDEDKAEVTRLMEIFTRRTQKLAYRYAARWADANIPHEDLRQEAMVWMLDAADRFDPSRGGFSGYALWRMRHGLTEYVKRKCPSVHVPGNVLKDQQKIKKVAHELLAELQRPATRAELCRAIPNMTNSRLEIAIALWEGVEVTNYDDKAEWLTGIADGED